MTLGPRWQRFLIVGGGMACLLGAWILVGIFAGRWKSAPPTAVAGPAPLSAEHPTPTPSAEWVVYLTGAVRRPGVYTVPSGSRLVAVVDKAGGMTPDADAEGVNLAQAVADGSHLHVPRRGDGERLAALLAPGRSSGDGAVGKIRDPELAGKALLNLNTASAAELETLPGIGPKGAQAILEDRNRHGPFMSVEDLLRVKGIGPKKLDTLRPLVTVSP